jgi:hypothetical protein
MKLKHRSHLIILKRSEVNTEKESMLRGSLIMGDDDDDDDDREREHKTISHYEKCIRVA